MKYKIEFNMPERKDAMKRELGDNRIEIEDGGLALLYSPDEADGNVVENGGDGHFFVYLRSWENTGSKNGPEFFDGTMHPLFGKFEGKRVRVTVEVVD